MAAPTLFNEADSSTMIERQTLQLESEETTRLTMVERQQQLLKSGVLSDCTFIVGNADQIKEFNVHKFPLFRASDVFLAMFQGDWAEKLEVRVTDIHPSVFQSLLEFLYTDQLQLTSVQHALDVCMAANKYLVTALVNKCVQYLQERLRPGNVCQILEFALLIEHEWLKSCCLLTACEQTTEVILSDSFIHCDISSLMTILQQDRLNVESEAVLFSALVKWGLHQTRDQGQLRAIFTPLLPYIRLRCLTLEQFLRITDGTSFISSDEKIDILTCILNHDRIMPPDFSNEITKRSRFNQHLLKNHGFVSKGEFNLKEIKKNETSLISGWVQFSVTEDVHIYGFELFKFPLSKDIKMSVVVEKSELNMEVIVTMNGDFNFIVEFKEPISCSPSDTFVIYLKFHHRIRIPPNCTELDAPKKNEALQGLFYVDEEDSCDFFLFNNIFYKKCSK